ncbi:MAG: 3-oxoacid CoA-transferase [Lachnospiraceae bacterium]|nr:3-oxoacid CoA-transferase [Lachnospiraceae bacterium]
MVKILTAREAVELIKDNDTVALGGFGAYSAPDELFAAVADRFAETGHPMGLTCMTGISAGNFDKEHGVGLSRLKADGLMTTLIAGHIGNPPDVANLVGANKIAGYILPLGVVMHLFRAMAGRQPGIISKVGLGTYADPREEGCMGNDKAREQGREIVKLLNIDGEDYLFYKSVPLNVCLLRGTYADEDGNISIAHEALTEAQSQIAAAVHNNGGTVIFQVEDIVARGSIPPREVRVHKSLVDVVVKASPETQRQSYAVNEYHPELTGEIRVPVNAIAPMKMSLRKVIARRGAMELKPGCVINLGIGIPSGVGSVANEEGIGDQMTLSLESGPIGGVPVEGLGFGGSVNADQIAPIPDTFDLYDGGFLDMTCLGAAEIDKEGNVNVSKFGTRCTGPGGFINISQNTPKVCFMLGFTATKPELAFEDGRLNIVKDGEGVKFVEKVQQITFSGAYARKTGQKVLYITERAVFELREGGVTLTEIAPGADLEKDILAHMGFKPQIAEDLKEMDSRLFREGKMGLGK